MFFYLCKELFSGFLQFNGNFVDAQNNSKYRDCAPLNKALRTNIKAQLMERDAIYVQSLANYC